jgi:hypothetical protein
MVIIYAVVSIVGAATTAALLGQHSLLFAVVAAPLGGSLSAAVCAVVFASYDRSEAIPPHVVWG